ncbi:MAG: hypothetical protein D6761_11590 [Candidatus Dadabacteria bacterium]|nr:MAG: hypothetical protein D6761_11590 [Candidatus Dadabacteria bacterium]
MFRVILFLIMVGVSACASSEAARKALMPYVHDYNEMIRWEAPEKAAPLVAPEAAHEFRDWSRDTVEDYDFQEWSVRDVTHESEVTATVVIERKGYQVPKYIEKTFTSVQHWEYIDGIGWRLKEGF